MIALTISTVRKALKDANIKYLHLSIFSIKKTVKIVLFSTKSDDFSKLISLIKMRTRYIGEHFIERCGDRVAILFTYINPVTSVLLPDAVCKETIDTMMKFAFCDTPFEVSTFDINTESREITLCSRMVFTENQTTYPPDSVFAIQPYIVAYLKAFSNLRITNCDAVKNTTYGDLIGVKYDLT